MKVLIQDVKAIKPNILRISAYTIEETDNGIVTRDYELAVLTNDFANITNPENIEIDIDALKVQLSRQIVDLQFTAALARAILAADLEWDINVTDAETKEKATPKSVEGKSFAHANGE